MTKELVFIKENNAVTDSLIIADMFGKRHDHVLRDIENQMLLAGEEFSVPNFGESTYTNERGRTYPKYDLTEEAFTLVVFSYNTKEAVQTKIKFIKEFKRMKEYIQNQQQPKTQLEALQCTVNQMVEQERRLTVVETRLIETEKNQDRITEILSLNPTEWRKKVNNLINKIAQARGGFQAYQDVRNESYEALEERANAKLSVRLTNKKGKMALEGVAKSRIDKVNKMDVIADDSRLTEIYLAVVKEMAIKYGVNLNNSSKEIS
ncbi:phage antirepressor protein [Bacillus sp. WMMC1349]|uniref:Rha family transcriptional regulator n=1 Tax=Bacillus sp. WMMC1349 TaxID=2736254 RepID=UPI001552D2F8|nr:Rha family transcriptional regulator [Bacillus sp. WMMC1349]NPC94819.1 phage antirepressor protein [Bacillus sp. WMMC1349]NPC94867.1 phage antirepressor protein [Bacillus sp. WMMC1349]